jgi:hypothetical protein
VSQILTNQAIPRETLSVIKDGTFGVADFEGLEKIHKKTQGSGIYLILYTGVLVEGLSADALYVGKTINFGQRYQQHAIHIDGQGIIQGSYNHYSIARTNTKWRMIKLANIPAAESVATRIAEHTFVSLFDSWNPKVLSEPETVTQFATKGPAYGQASVLRKIALRVFQRTGWRSRTEHGLNWQTPLADRNLEHVLWTSITIPQASGGEIVQFQRSAKRVVSSGSNSKYLRIMGIVPPLMDGSSDGVTMSIPSDIGISAGQMVHVIVEVRKNCGPHPHPYARASVIGPLSGWSLLNTMGIRIEWRSATGWKAYWLQSGMFFDSPSFQDRDMRRNNPLGEYLSDGYCRTMNILDYLMRVEYYTDSTYSVRVTDIPWGPCRPAIVTNVRFDWFTQKLVSTSVGNIKLVYPQIQSLEDNRRRLETAFPDIYIGPRHESMFVDRQKHRTACDLCLLVSTLKGGLGTLLICCTAQLARRLSEWKGADIEQSVMYRVAHRVARMLQKMQVDESTMHMDTA